MKIVIFYFSGTGNTWWVSKELKKELEKLKNSVEMYSIENRELQVKGFADSKVEQADQVIVGFPTYGSDVPKNMYKFIRKLPDVTDNKKFASFCSQAIFSGDGTIFFKNEIEEKGYSFSQSFQINMTINFNVAIFPFSLFKPAKGKKLEKIKNKASKKIAKTAGKISRHEKHIEGRRFYQLWFGRLQRKYFRKGERTLMGLFKFVKDRCCHCRLCLRICPTKNLILDPKHHILRRGKNCMFCFRCYNFCTTLAVNYGKRIKKPEDCKRYKGPDDDMKITDIMK